VGDVVLVTLLPRDSVRRTEYNWTSPFLGCILLLLRACVAEHPPLAAVLLHLGDPLLHILVFRPYGVKGRTLLPCL
jgi:hypothetical protein